ncbi:hypothetical protein K3152_04245 [Qipengyuania sp. 1NDH17]|uniref:Uncharacterized protein n=1 Tax=Qipengyuania polymorpha TaxID=2867234 RepID=A0ABS7J067_9SPHN|nr:hypothetical protein [Qipengyuania polymorpha]MBX7457449.1 hypothetical protein [Qipengyuania polymorpha]
MKKPVILALASMVATPIAAQDSDHDRRMERFLRPESQIGTRFKQEPETAGEAETRQMQKRLAKCVYFGNKEELNELLDNSDFEQIAFADTQFKSGEFFDDIGFGRCIGRVMKRSQYKLAVSVSYSTLRNLIAEEAYLYENKDVPVRAPGAPLLIDQRFATQRGGMRAQSVSELADCLTYRNARASHELLDSTPATDKESEALEALYPTLLTCLETDEAPNLSTSLVRQMVADGMWSRSYYNGFAPAETNEAEAD